MLQKILGYCFIFIIPVSCATLHNTPTQTIEMVTNLKNARAAVANDTITLRGKSIVARSRKPLTIYLLSADSLLQRTYTLRPAFDRQSAALNILLPYLYIYDIFSPQAYYYKNFLYLDSRDTDTVIYTRSTEDDYEPPEKKNINITLGVPYINKYFLYKQRL